MPDPYPRLARTADNMLARYGKTASIIKTIPGGYDPGSGTTLPDTTITYSAIAVEMTYEVQDLPGTLIQVGDKLGAFKITDPTFTGEVGTGMKIQLAGDVARTLVEIQPIVPGPTRLYWKFVARA